MTRRLAETPDRRRAPCRADAALPAALLQQARAAPCDGRVTTSSACAGPCSIAISTFNISSSRGGGSSTGTACHHAPSSSRPAAVISYDFWPLVLASSSTSPSRSRRSSVVYTCPTLSGQIPPVAPSNSVFS